MANLRMIETMVDALLKQNPTPAIQPGITYGVNTGCEKQPWLDCITRNCFNEPCRADMREKGCPIVATNPIDISPKPAEPFTARWPRHVGAIDLAPRS